MLLELGDDPIELILDIFNARIKQEKEYRSTEVIPHDFNPELQAYLAGHQYYKKEMTKWLQDMTPRMSTYNWNVTHFIQEVGGASYSAIVMDLIERSDTKSLFQAINALESMEGTDFGLCLEIVKRTDNEDILNKVEAAMFATGVVSGENGLAEALEEKANLLDKYTTSENPRISAFANKTKKSFEESAQRSRTSSRLDKKARRLKFEGP
jgi:hypothetical protein